MERAALEVALLEAIAANPGQQTTHYAKAINRRYTWVLVTLRQYEEDGVVESFLGDRRSRLWRLT